MSTELPGGGRPKAANLSSKAGKSHVPRRFAQSFAGLLTVVTVVSVNVACSSTGASKAVATRSSTSQARDIRCVAGEAHLEATSFPSFPSDVVVGPLAWPRLRDWATADPAGYQMGGSSNDFKIGAEVSAGATVVVAVADEAKAYGGLDYGQAWNYSPTQAVTFHACQNTATAFVGGFHVVGRRCVPFDVTPLGGLTTRVTVSFFAGSC